MFLLIVLAAVSICIFFVCCSLYAVKLGLHCYHCSRILSYLQVFRLMIDRRRLFVPDLIDILVGRSIIVDNFPSEEVFLVVATEVVCDFCCFSDLFGFCFEEEEAQTALKADCSQCLHIEKIIVLLGPIWARWQIWRAGGFTFRLLLRPENLSISLDLWWLWPVVAVLMHVTLSGIMDVFSCAASDRLFQLKFS